MVPDVEVFEDSPGNKINLSKELAQGKGLIIGVPAAFSPGCSDSHIPGYLADARTKDAGKAFVVSVNDAFVMKAWGKSLDKDKTSGLRFVGDAAGEFSASWDTLFDASSLMGNYRSKRYAVLTEDGKVTKVAIEPDNIGVNVSAADKFLQ